MRLVLRSRSWKSTTGREELIGEEGIAISGLGADIEGMIRVHGELWQAISPRAVLVGKPVRVRSVEGLKLYVEPEEAAVTENK
jgi:membrane-bound serine protease (ClpP class)